MIISQWYIITSTVMITFLCIQSNKVNYKYIE